MLISLAAVLALLALLAWVAAVGLHLSGRRVAACGVNGLALAAVVGGGLLAVLVNPDPGLNTAGLGWGAVLVVAAAQSLLSAWRGARGLAGATELAWVYWIGLLSNAGVALALGYLLLGFSIF